MRQFQRPFIESRIYSTLVANILRNFHVMCIYIFALILFASWSYTSHWLMCFIVNTTENKAYLILYYLKGICPCSQVLRGHFAINIHQFKNACRKCSANFELLSNCEIKENVYIVLFVSKHILPYT